MSLAYVNTLAFATDIATRHKPARVVESNLEHNMAMANSNAISLDEFKQFYEQRVEAPMSQPSERVLVEAPNGESVYVTFGITTNFPGFTSLIEHAPLGVIVEPANLPDDVQSWGRRFAGPAWPAWPGVRAAVEAVGEDTAALRARIL